MITDAGMYHKAQRVLATLGDTPAERERARVIVDHMLIWEWAHDDAPAAEVIQLPRIHPKAARFLDWWDRNRCAAMWQGLDWIAGFVWWSDRVDLGDERIVVFAAVDDEIGEAESQRGAA